MRFFPKDDTHSQTDGFIHPHHSVIHCKKLLFSSKRKNKGSSPSQTEYLLNTFNVQDTVKYHLIRTGYTAREVHL